jgi:hypothetical protein
MASQVYGRVLVFAAALALAACASTIEPSLQPGNRYQLVKKIGKDFYCRKQVPVGSRTRGEVHCVTPEMFAALSKAPTPEVWASSGPP